MAYTATLSTNENPSLYSPSYNAFWTTRLHW